MRRSENPQITQMNADLEQQKINLRESAQSADNMEVCDEKQKA